MFETRLRFLASDDDFDDFAFEETVDLEFEIGEYRLEDHEEELDTVSPVIVFVPPPRVVITSPAPAVQSMNVRDKRQTRKPLAKVAKTDKKISLKQRTKEAAKKAVKKAIKKTVVKAPAKKAPAKKAPATVKKSPPKKAPVKKAPAKKTPAKKATKKTAKKK